MNKIFNQAKLSQNYISVTENNYIENQLAVIYEINEIEF